MNWLLYALGAPILWALVNVTDQYLVKTSDKKNHPVGSLVIFSSLIGIFVAIFIYVFTHGSISISGKGELILILTGVINAVCIILYLTALSIEDLTTVYPWILTIPFFSYLFGYIFLGENLSSIQIIGGSIICLGGLIISLEQEQLYLGKIKFRKLTTLYMLTTAILAALGSILFKFVAEDTSFWASSFWEYTGLAITGVMIFIFIKRFRLGFFSMLKKGGKKIFALNATSELFTVIGNLLFRFATLLAPVALVSLVEPIQSVLVFIFALFGTIFFPKIIKEDISKRVLLHKLTAILIMFLGSFLLFHS